MKNPTYSLHTFSSKEDMKFSERKYSLFKHGMLSMAKEMGTDLAKGFCENYPVKDITKQIVVYPSPYYFIPSAAAVMTKYFLNHLNNYLVDVGRSPALPSTILRNLSYHTDYGKMNVEEREKLIAMDKFYIDKDFVRDKHTLHVDDVRITGSHEKEIFKLLGGTETDYTCLYYAASIDPNPKLEDYLNNNYVDNIYHIVNLMRDERNFFFNVRNIRAILCMNNEDFNIIIPSLSEEMRKELWNLCIGNLYHTVEHYKQNLLSLKRHINGNIKHGQAIHEKRDSHQYEKVQ